MVGLSNVFEEIRRRKIFRAAVAYLVVAWLLVEVASVVLPTFEAPAWVLQAFTFLMILGLPLALVLAWAFDITPTGIKRDVAVAAPADQQPDETGTAAPQRKSIAVLPFVNMSEDAKNAYFSDGITEEISSKLARLGQLRVASRTSVACFKGIDMDVKQIARQLGVRYVLEGSVRKSAERVRTTVQLIDSKDGFHLWAEEFDGSLDDIFAVQEEAAVRVADALNLEITSEERQVLRLRYTDNSKAFDAYLEGQALVQYTDSFEKLGVARGHFNRALALDPEYSAALAGLASVEVHIYRNFESSADHLAKARDLASKALASAPGLARAHVAVGEVMAIEYQYRDAARKFRDAIRIQPDDPWTWDSLSWVLAYQQPPDGQAAEKAAREAIRMQPQFSVAYYHLGRALLIQQRYDEAVAAFEHIRELSSDSKFTNFGLAQVQLAKGEFKQALERLNATPLGGTAARVVLISTLAALGDNDAALAELKKAFEVGLRDFAGLDANTHLSVLRQDPRFRELVQHYRRQCCSPDP